MLGFTSPSVTLFVLNFSTKIYLYFVLLVMSFFRLIFVWRVFVHPTLSGCDDSIYLSMINIENVVRILRNEGTKFCQMQRKSTKSKL